MAWPYWGVPQSDNYQDNNFNGYDWRNRWPYDFDPFNFNPTHPWFPDNGHRRTAPREPPFVDYDPDNRGWYQGNHKMPSNFKPKKYWARPVDGKRKGAFGRLADGLTGEGADVFVVLNGDKRTLMRDMPHRAQWSKWGGYLWDPNFGQWRWDKDATSGEAFHKTMPWAGKGDGKRYNFQTREYEDRKERAKNHMQNRLWTDAHWPEGAGRYDMNPLSFRTDPWVYQTAVSPYAGLWAGGRPRMGT
ncbi:hypothetical protein LTR85_003079 [Meristemomyces frigidus]|nr:hypothetical protein LTR85_003079 [Meristemomyces frigidus]